MSQSLIKYDSNKSYQWNYDNAPSLIAESETDDSRSIELAWQFCGLPVRSPIGIAAGPLLNGKWLLHYASLGFDILTYKTVRSAAHPCYPLPNLQPIIEHSVEPGGETHATETLTPSWAISFGMPSATPEVWQRDIKQTRERLCRSKILVVSVVATATSDMSLEDIADDYALCARLARESGADCIELNLSCPNVSTLDGQLYQCPESTAQVLRAVREQVAETPIIVKIGTVEQDSHASALMEVCMGLANAISMTNCIACTVRSRENLLFDGERRGIGGSAIRGTSVGQIRRFAKLLSQRSSDLSLIGVGGISEPEHCQQYLSAGASSVQVATAAMQDPSLGARLQSSFAP